MKYCTECGKELGVDVKVCGNCGKKILTEYPTSNVISQDFISNNNQKKDSNGFAIAGFVISLVSLILCCGSISWLGLLFSVIGVVNAKKVDGKNKVFAIIGIVLGLFGIMLIIIVLYMIGIVISVIDSAGGSIGTSL